MRKVHKTPTQAVEAVGKEWTFSAGTFQRLKAETLTADGP